MNYSKPILRSSATALLVALFGCQSQNEFWHSVAQGLANSGASANEPTGYAQPPPTFSSTPPTLGAPSGYEEAVETYIDGEFKGWDGDTIWKMDNGQIWQQEAYSYHYHYAYHPSVIIVPTEMGWKMKVEGDDESVYVKRLK